MYVLQSCDVIIYGEIYEQSTIVTVAVVAFAVIAELQPAG